MNLFNFLKSKAGKLVMGTPQIAVLTIGAAGLVASAAYNVGSQQGEKERSLRSLTAINSSYNYEGLNRHSDGMLSSMNIQNRAGSKGVAVGADRERLEGYSSKNDFGVSAAENLGNRVSVAGVGSAAATSATDGLGSGGVDMLEIPAGTASARSSAPGVNAGGVSQGALGGSVSGANGATSGSNPSGTLASASMARASGNAFNAAAGSMGGTHSSSASRGGSSSRGSGTEGYSFSGSMPSGSNIVSSYADAGLGRGGRGSSFIAGGKNSKVGKGRRTFSEQNDLKDISKRSADAARNSTRAANEGSRAFLAGTQNSGGMTIESGEETAATGSADFETPTNKKLKSIGDWGNKEDEKGKERSKDRNDLAKWLMITFFTTIVAIPLGFYLIKAGKESKGFWGIALIVAGCAVLAAAAGIAITTIAKAGHYAHKWEGGILSTLSGVLGGISVAALALTAAAALSYKAGAEKQNPLTRFVSKFIPGAKKLAISQVVSKGTELASNGINEEVQKDAQKDSAKKK